jgi:uncharacterized protein (DUF433 family)
MSVPLTAEALPLQRDQHGSIRVGGTRVTLDTVIHTFNEGADAEEIAKAFPTLSLADIYTVIGYYLRHREEIDAYLAEREEQAREIRRQHEARFGSQEGLKERLLARRRQQS